jgi:hypothetical protein
MDFKRGVETTPRKSMSSSDSPCDHWKTRRTPPDGPSYRHRVPDCRRVSGAAEFSSRTRRQPQKMHSKRSQGSGAHTLGGSFPHGRPREKSELAQPSLFPFPRQWTLFRFYDVSFGDSCTAKWPLPRTYTPLDARPILGRRKMGTCQKSIAGSINGTLPN